MLEYGNLSAIEFEYLCQDIMQKRLNISLRRFTSGKDDGIDLCNDCNTKEVLIQVKHYYRSSFSNLLTALKKELPKVKELNPKQYYICCSQCLTPDNVLEIHRIFSDYMPSEKNIVTLIEIDNFLNEKDHIEILRKHFKLWLSSTNILSEIHNQDIFIDSESLLYDINEDLPYYVQTELYHKSKHILEQDRLLMLIGNPGVGKTTISKMLVLFFASIGYSVRYVTNGDISDIKKALSTNNNQKEIVLLDDCLGQCYFRLKDTQEIELSSLVKYIYHNSNKILLLNSRISIFNEAKARSLEFTRLFDNETIKIKKIDVDHIQAEEKAQIFYSLLKKFHVSNEHYKSVRDNKNYREIIFHPNYNPRIIEYVTWNYREVNTPGEYYNYILDKIKSPRSVWDDEFERKLNTADRYFMYTVYSLTSTLISIDALREAFEHVLALTDVDLSLHHFESTLARLSKSLIRIVANEYKKIRTPEGIYHSVANNSREIGVLNPSINDYLRSIFDGSYLKDFFRKNALFLEQIVRMSNTREKFDHEIKKLVQDNKLKNMKTIPPEYQKSLILYIVVQFKILDNQYEKIILEGLQNYPTVYYLGGIFNPSGKKSEIIQSLLSEPFYSFYHMSDKINQLKGIEFIYSNLKLEDFIQVSNKLNCMLDFKGVDKAAFVQLTKEKLNEAAQDYADACSSNYEAEDNDTTFDSFSNHIWDNLYDLLDRLEIPEIQPEDVDVDISEWDTEPSTYNSGAYDSYMQYEKNEIDLILDRDIDF